MGIYFVFRDETQAETFRASRFRTQISSSRIKIEPKRFKEYLSILQPLMDFVTERGRLPEKEELPTDELITKEFRSLKRAFSYIKLATNAEEWGRVCSERTNDMLVI